MQGDVGRDACARRFDEAPKSLYAKRVRNADGSEVYLKSIAVAVSGRVFQGLASDNLLHFNLNSIYVQVEDDGLRSRFFGCSLALYMIGISIGPFIGGLFENFVDSLIMSIAVFVVAILYLVYLGKNTTHRLDRIIPRDDGSTDRNLALSKASLWKDIVPTLLSPLYPFRERPIANFPGLSLLIYNVSQSYIFVAIMVHTSLNFEFTSRQNGFLIALVHLVAAIYLLLTLLIIPTIIKLTSKMRHSGDARSEPTKHKFHDTIFAQVSMLMQTASLVLAAEMTESWQIYPIGALCALGLATPSFVKPHFAGFFHPSEGPRAMAGLTLMETIGGLLAPIVLGSLQTAVLGSDIFFVAAGMVAVSFVLFTIGVFAKNRSNAFK